MAEAFGKLPTEILALDAETFNLNYDILRQFREVQAREIKSEGSLTEKIRRKREELAREGLIEVVS